VGDLDGELAVGCFRDVRLDQVPVGGLDLPAGRAARRNWRPAVIGR
jgi:hypothetical protein